MGEVIQKKFPRAKIRVTDLFYNMVLAIFIVDTILVMNIS